MTDAASEARVAMLLGLDPDEAVDAVLVLCTQELLPHGVAVIAAATASRWGVELPDALRRLAEGRPHGDMFSDYELRVAHQEAESELGAPVLDSMMEPLTLGDVGSARLAGIPAVEVSDHHIDPQSLAAD